MTERGSRGAGVPILQLQGVNVFYGRSHAVQGVDLALQSGVLSVVGRNGMGKTTMCKAIMGLVRSRPVPSASWARSLWAARRPRSRGWASAMCRRGAASGVR